MAYKIGKIINKFNLNPKSPMSYEKQAHTFNFSSSLDLNAQANVTMGRVLTFTISKQIILVINM
jgi:hypothetical protein